MSVLRHNKEKEFYNKILKVLEEKYDGNIHKYKDAERDVITSDMLNKKLKKISAINKSIENMKYSYTKYTHIDLKTMTASVAITDTPECLLAYNLDFLKIKRIFPFPLQYLLDKSKSIDLSKVNKKDNDKTKEATKVLEWVKQRVLGNNFVLNNLSINKNTGQINYNTMYRDPNYGGTLQYLTAFIPKDKIVEITGTDLKKSAYELSKSYDSLFLYFSMFGFTDFYIRCTCQEYVKRFSKKHGIANYFCPHILYSLAQFPYYMMYAL